MEYYLQALKKVMKFEGFSCSLLSNIIPDNVQLVYEHSMPNYFFQNKSFRYVLTILEESKILN